MRRWVKTMKRCEATMKMHRLSLFSYRKRFVRGVLFLFLIVPAVIAASLQVTVEHTANLEGHIAIGLYTDEGFPEVDKEYQGVYRVPTGTSTTYTFHDLPVGCYAVAVYHDKNDNMRLDKNLFGIPREAYGFSNGVKARFSAPKFKEAAVHVQNESHITISMTQE